METKDYDMFKYFSDNRGNMAKELNQGLIERLILSIQKHGYVSNRAILIDQNNFIIDGQHRLEACKKLQIPAVYERKETDNHHELMLDLNRNQLIWRLADFISSFANQGQSEYVYLKNIENTYSLGWSNTIKIVGNNHLRANYIREGRSFIINPFAKDIAEYILSMKELPFYQTSHFVCAIVDLWKKTSKEQRSKLYTRRLEISQAASMSGFLIIFENIINKHTKNKVILNINK